MNLNKAFIVGNMTRDPESRTTPNGQTVANFGVATNRFWKDPSGQKQQKAEFHNVIAWGRLGEICAQYLKKGQLVFVEGRIETRSWEGQDGVKKSKTEIVAENIQFGPKMGGGTNQSSDYKKDAATNNIESNEIPTIEDEIEVKDVPF